MIKLVDQLSAMGSFPIATAQDIVCSDNERLQEKIDNGTLGGGGGSTAITITQEEYDALDPQEQLEGEFYCYDSGRHFRNGVEYGKDGVQISDNETVEDKTWSSKKTSDEIDALISDASSTTSTYSSAKIDEKIAEHSLPLLYDTGMFANSSVIIFKLANVLKRNAIVNFNNLNLLLSTRRGDEVEIVTGKDDNGYWIQAYRRSDSATKISAMYKDGDDVYIKLELYANFLRVYHKSGVLRDDFAVSKVDTIPDTATEVTIRPLPTYVSDNSTNSVSTWSSSKINSKLGGLTFSASGTTLTITNGTNTWTLKANS